MTPEKTEVPPDARGDAFGHEFAVALESDETTPDQWTDEAIFSDEASAEQQTAGGDQPTPQQVQQQPEPSQPQATPPASSEVTPPVDTSQQRGSQPADQQTPEQQAEAKKWAGKYDSPEKLEDGYKNIQRLQSRTYADLQRAELERQQMAAFLEQVKPYLPYLQQIRQQQQQGALPDDLSQLDPQQLQAFIQQQVVQQTQAVEQRVRQETAQELEGRQVADTVARFLSENNIEVDSDIDHAIGALVEEFQTDAEGNEAPQLFPITPDNLSLVHELAQDESLRQTFLDLDLVPNRRNVDIAKQAVADPALGEILLAQPDLATTDHGLNYARKMSQLPGMYAQAVQQAAPPSPEQVRRAAHVETGGTGAPVQSAPGALPKDEFDEALDAYLQNSSDNAFGLAIAE